MVIENSNVSKRSEFYRESTFGSFETDPSFTFFADDVISNSVTINPNKEEQRPNDSAYASDHKPGSEISEGTTNYLLQHWLRDGSNNAQDASYDGAVRDSDGYLPNSHGCLHVTKRSSGGNDSGGIWTTEVWKGAKIDEVTYTWDTGTGLPIDTELNHTIQKARVYDLHQPSTSTTLAVDSTDSGDTTQTLTVENEDASTSETFSLDGTNLVTASTSFSEIGQIQLDSETTGDVKVYVNDGDQTTPAAGSTLAVIRGTGYYAAGWEGDLGTPIIGSGSHGSALGLSNEEIFRAHTIERPDGSSVEENIVEGELSISNNIDTTPTDGDQLMNIQEGNADVSASLTVFGETATVDQIDEMLGTDTGDFRWEATGGTLILNTAQSFSEIERAIDEGDTRVTVDTEFRPTGVTFA